MGGCSAHYETFDGTRGFYPLDDCASQLLCIRKCLQTWLHVPWGHNFGHYCPPSSRFISIYRRCDKRLFYLYISSREDTLCAFKVTSRHTDNLFLTSDLGSGGNLEFCAEWPPGQGRSGGGYSARKAQSISVEVSSTGDTQHGPERHEKRSLELPCVSPFYPLNCISVCFLLFKTLVF